MLCCGTRLTYIYLTGGYLFSCPVHEGTVGVDDDDDDDEVDDDD